MSFQQSYNLLNYNKSNAYEDFISKNVKDKIVIDCNAGNGLITWLCLKYGAKKVYCLENNQHAYLHLRNYVFRKNSRVELLNINSVVDDLPKGDIYIHDLFSTLLFDKGLLNFLNNCRKQNITNLYPNKIQIVQGIIDKKLEENIVPDQNHLFDCLHTQARSYVKLMNKLYPTLLSTQVNVFKSSYNTHNEHYVYDGNLLELSELSIKFVDKELSNVWWNAFFNNEYFSSLCSDYNTFNVGMQTLNNFKRCLRSSLIQ